MRGDLLEYLGFSWEAGSGKSGSGRELLEVQYAIVVELLKGIFSEVPVTEVIRDISVTWINETLNDG